MPVMRSQDVDLSSQSTSSDGIPQVTSVYIQLPAHTRILSYHVWLGLVVNTLHKMDIRVGWLTNVQNWWQPYRVPLQWLEDYYRKYQTFTGYLSEVLRSCSEEDMDKIVSFGEQLNNKYESTFEQMAYQALEFLHDAGISSIVTRDENKAFDLWYETHFEPTSAAHRATLKWLACGKEDFARLGILYLIMPNEIILAVKSNKPQTQPLCSAHHWVMSYDPSPHINDTVLMCRKCGITEDEYDQYNSY